MGAGRQWRHVRLMPGRQAATASAAAPVWAGAPQAGDGIGRGRPQLVRAAAVERAAASRGGARAHPAAPSISHALQGGCRTQHSRHPSDGTWSIALALRCSAACSSPRRRRLLRLPQAESDVQMLLASSAHLGTKNCTSAMERYVYRRRNDGIFVFNLQKTCVRTLGPGGGGAGGDACCMPGLCVHCLACVAPYEAAMLLAGDAIAQRRGGQDGGAAACGRQRQPAAAAAAAQQQRRRGHGWRPDDATCAMELRAAVHLSRFGSRERQRRGSPLMLLLHQRPPADRSHPALTLTPSQLREAAAGCPHHRGD